MNQDIRVLKFFLGDFLREHKKVKRILEEINCAYRSFLYLPLFNRLNLNEFRECLEKRLQSKEQKL